MTIRPGEEWGSEVARPPDLLVVPDDAALAAALAAHEQRPLAVAGGDLHRTLGAPTTTGSVVRCVPVDVLDVELDGARQVAVAHVVARRPGPTGWWRGPIVAVMNTDHLGAWSVAPRNHPNDGRAEIVEVDPSMPMRQRWAARRRLPTGTFLPHPAISTRSRPSASWTFASPLTVWLDGRRLGPTRSLRVTVLPDAVSLHL
ncbi:MAG: hypothetical protein MUE78_05710 [Ilumatobacteraceae bacterium]|jgi:hypothetical protein|nr:hypothetical protein [Ilumatobacteraceae bacterium]